MLKEYIKMLELRKTSGNCDDTDYMFNIDDDFGKILISWWLTVEEKYNILTESDECDFINDLIKNIKEVSQNLDK